MPVPTDRWAHPAVRPAQLPARRPAAPPAGLRRVPGPAMPRAVRWLLPAMIFCAFLTQIKLIPGIGTNIGPFEIVSGLLIGFFTLHRASHTGLQLNTLSKLLLAIAALACLSQTNIRPENTRTGIIQTLIVINLFLVVTVLYNLARRYRISPRHVLTIVTYSVLIVGPWVVASGIRSGGDIQASGPFRNRAHMATYMLTAFWMVVVFLLLPGLRKTHRYAGYVAAMLCLYAVAVSGRRSVYLALLVGLGLLVGVFVLASRGKRTRTLVAASLAVAFLGWFYVYGGLLFPQAGFFQNRLGSVGERVRAFVTPSDTPGEEGNFYALQREGVMLAFRENPLLGVGWGGFVKSTYSPTGHEVHSTPLRFLAELGLPGLLLYLALVGYLLLDSARLFQRMRRTPYSASYLALAVATSSLAISNIYNRHITERTFWVFLVVFLTMQVFSRIYDPAAARRPARRGAASRTTLRGRALGTATAGPGLARRSPARRSPQRRSPARKA